MPGILACCFFFPFPVFFFFFFVFFDHLGAPNELQQLSREGKNGCGSAISVTERS